MEAPVPTVLVINPGSTSTKIALFSEEGPQLEENLEHPAEELAVFSAIVEQLPLREQALGDFLARAGDPKLDAVVGRGGPLKPLEGGTYEADDGLLEDLRSAKYGEHASLLGGLLARRAADARGIPAYVVDPVTVDELDALARVSGVKGIERSGRSHALSLKAVTRLAAARVGKPLEQSRFVAAHLGGGISVAAMKGGRIVDVNDALLGMGPFSANRAGALPIHGLLDLAFAPGAERRQLEKFLAGEAGLMSYLGTADLKEIERRAEGGDEKAAFAFRAMIYQIAKEIGAVAASLKGRVEGVILTGGMSRSDFLLQELRPYIDYLGPVFHYPGEREMEALAQGAIRVLENRESARSYWDAPSPENPGFSVRRFEDLLHRVENAPSRSVAVAGAAKVSVIEALREAVRRKLVKPILVGPEKIIRKLCVEHMLPLEHCTFVDVDGDDEALAQAAVSEVHEGRAGLLMKGSVPTAILLRATLDKEKGLRAGRVLSHVAVTESPSYSRFMLHTDGGINLVQDLETRKSILANAVDLARLLEIEEPRIAGLALTEEVNPDIPETVEMRELAGWVNGGALGKAFMEGPVALDVALSHEAADIKGLESRLAGETDIFLGPNISTTNFVVKALLQLRQAKVAGLVLGAKVPIVLLSRSDSPETRLFSLALGAYYQSRVESNS
jgi:butyrate kinase